MKYHVRCYCGSTFNTTGKGPLHEGRAMCTGSIVISEAINIFTGHCYFGDKDGDHGAFNCFQTLTYEINLLYLN